MRVAFHSNQLGLRGTEIALYDYANYNESLLANESLIISNKHARNDAFDKFNTRFQVELYDNVNSISEICKKNDIDVLYMIKAGHDDGILSTSCTNAVHCVFKNNSPHGDIYAYVSEWLAREASNLKYPWVPHIVHLPGKNISVEDSRKQFNIPLGVRVFGYYGGNDSFDIAFVKQAVINRAKADKNTWFVFMNVNRFCDESIENVKFFNGTHDLAIKTAFIQSCDAMLHARFRGETFGLAVGEFSLFNKPIITYYDSSERQHIEILKDYGIYYQNEEHLNFIFDNFEYIRSTRIGDEPYHLEFSPENVMKKFNSVFLCYQK